MSEKYDIRNLAKDIGLFFKGATDFDRKSKAMLEKEASYEMDYFMLLCFADVLGLPLPTNYYTLELLPYLAEDMDQWLGRMVARKSMWEEKGSDYDFDV